VRIRVGVPRRGAAERRHEVVAASSRRRGRRRTRAGVAARPRTARSARRRARCLRRRAAEGPQGEPPQARGRGARRAAPAATQRTSTASASPRSARQTADATSAPARLRERRRQARPACRDGATSPLAVAALRARLSAPGAARSAPRRGGAMLFVRARVARSNTARALTRLLRRLRRPSWSLSSPRASPMWARRCRRVVIAAWRCVAASLRAAKRR
jgi:hypothetical protein